MRPGDELKRGSRPFRLSKGNIVTVRGVIQFVWYIVRIYGRHFRINVVRHGTLAALRPSLRGRHAGVGRGLRSNPLGRAHDALDGTPAMLLIRSLKLERGEVFA